MSLVTTYLFTYNGSWIILTVIFGILVILLNLLVQRALFVHALKKLPCPFALPIIGNAFVLHGDAEKFFKNLLKWRKMYGDVFKVWAATRPIVFLYKAEFVQQLLSSPHFIEKSQDYKYTQLWLGNGLLTSTGEIWHYRRKLLTPTFHRDILEKFFITIVQEAEILTTVLRNEVGKSEFDMVPYAKRASLDVICETVMGYKVNAQSVHDHKYLCAIESIKEIIQKRIVNVHLYPDVIFFNTVWGKEYLRTANVIQDFVREVMTDRMASRKLNKNTINGEGVKRRTAMLDLLLEALDDNANLSENDVLDEVNTFMFAGHDTVATSIYWTLYNLGRYPMYQQMILDEFHEEIGSDEITFDGLNKLKLLEACIKETWRLYPPVTLFGRTCRSPITINGVECPAGTNFIVHSYLLHRDSVNFSNPEEYDPKRFLEGGAKYPNFSFIPFSAGPRNCIGMRLGAMTVKLMTLYTLKAFEVRSLDPEDKLCLRSNIILENANGIRLSITPRS
ncbi:cytochrome P450 4c3 [Orussus abietinus]|uniref:cytochrome P450 4c3 n=1 Tax=Orussus abietinus TaxID=222816 RepID=UPI0006253B34|nr:cytochrome P450 4c3 [Orussus abietinus]